MDIGIAVALVLVVLAALEMLGWYADGRTEARRMVQRASVQRKTKEVPGISIAGPLVEVPHGSESIA